MECNSSNEKAVFTFTWRIENFSYCVESKVGFFESPEFVADTLNKSRWCLRIYPKGINDRFCMNIFLSHLTFSSIPITVDYELSILGADGSCLLICNRTGVTFDSQFGRGIQTGLTQKDLYDTKRSTYLPQDTFSMRCHLWKTDEDTGENVQFFARTRIGLTRTSDLWSIPDFSKHQLRNRMDKAMLLSSVTPVSMVLKVSIEGETLDEAWLTIQICNRHCERQSLLSCKISVLNRCKREAKVIQDTHRFVPNQDLTWTFPKFISRRELIEKKSNLLPNDILSLRIEFALSIGVEHQEIESTHYGLPTPQSGGSTGHWWNTSGSSRNSPATDSEAAGILIDDLLYLYLEKTLSDFELKAGDATFSVHKALLCARSPVFKAMLTGDMQEGASKSLDIPDVDADTLSRMLLYVYSDTLEDLEWESASKLYYASDKYQILSLKRKCSSALESNLTVTNVSAVLSLADRHQDDELTSAVHDFVLSHDEEVMPSTEWLEFVKSEAQLAAKTMHEVYRKKLQIGS